MRFKKEVCTTSRMLGNPARNLLCLGVTKPERCWIQLCRNVAFWQRPQPETLNSKSERTVGNSFLEPPGWDICDVLIDWYAGDTGCKSSAYLIEILPLYRTWGDATQIRCNIASEHLGRDNSCHNMAIPLPLHPQIGIKTRICISRFKV